MKTDIKEEIEWVNFEGFIELSFEKFGIHWTISNSDVLLIYFMIQRKVIPNNTDRIVEFLMKNGYDSNQSITMVKRFRKVERELENFSLKTQTKLDRANQFLNPSIPFQQLENLHLGIVKENTGYKVVDISTGNEKLIARIKNGINWIDSNLSTNQMKWIMENSKYLDKNTKGII